MSVLLLVAGSLGASASAQQRAATFAGYKARISSVEFEAASVRKSAPGINVPVEWPQVQPGGRFIATNVSLVNLILRSYDVRDFQLRGVTDPVRRERYDIVATSGTGTTHEADVWMMVRNLLAQRFKLSLRIEQQDVTAQALVFARNDKSVGPNLKPLPPGVDCPTAKMDITWHDPNIVPPRAAPGTATRIMHNNCGPMSAIAAGFESYLLTPVIDGTGLQGEWMARLWYTRDRNASLPLDPNVPTLGTALREQWGLKIQETRAPMDFITIESVQPLIEN
jgi:uncharacterized protein (TIGR03435 family)